MHHVFLSYSRRDQVWVRQLAEALAPRAQVWLDQRDIPVSLPWLDIVQDAVEESFLFVICESPHWAASEPCAAEAAFADRFDVPVTRVRVGDDVADAVDRLAHEARLLDPTVATLTELRVRARDWHRAGRPRATLAGVQDRRRMERAGRGGRIPTVEARAYLAASRRASWRRSAALAVVSVLILGGVSGIRGASRAGTDAQEDMSDATIAAIGLGTNVQLIGMSPYLGLEAAIGSEGEDRAFDARVASEALIGPVPDDAFDAGATVEGFVGGDVGADVVVRTVDGDLRRRAAAATDERAATTVSEAPETSAGDDRPVATLVDGGGTLEVRVDGRLTRRLALPDRAEAVTASPEGRRVAVRLRRDVVVVDIPTGRVRTRLRGAPEDLGDVRWSADGRRVWATAGRHVVSWAVVTVDVLVDEPDSWFQALAPSGREDHMWLVRRDGPATLVDLETGEEVAREDPGFEVLAARGAPDGDRLALVGRDRLVVLDLDGGETVDLEVEDCDALRPTWTHDGAFLLVPCSGAPAAVIDPDDGRELGRIPLASGSWLTAFATDPATGEVLAGSAHGEVVAVDVEDGRVETRYEAVCHRSVLALAVAADEALAVAAGEGQGSTGCHGFAGADGVWTPLAVVVEGAALASAAVVLDTDGARGYALGYADGTVLLCSPPSCTSSLRLVDLSGAVRDMVVVDDHLVAVTRDGQVVRSPLPDIPLDLDGQIRRATARYDRAVELGLTSR